MLKANCVLAGMILAAGSTAAFGDVFIESHTGIIGLGSGSADLIPVYLYTDPSGFEHWSIEGRLISDGGGLLLLDSDDTNDIVDRVIIYNNSGTQRSVSVNIRDISTDDWERSSLAGIAKIKANTPSNTNINLHLLFMDGDVLAANPSDAIQVTNVDWIDIGGSIYGHIIARNETLSQPASDINMKIRLDGDLVEASIINKHGGIDWLEAGGSAIANGSSGTDVWASGIISKVQVLGSFAGRIGENGEGLSGNPDVSLLDIRGDFIGTGAMTIKSLETLTVGGDYNADVTINTAMAPTSFYKIGGSVLTNLPSGPQMTLPPNGLTEQIIINSGNTSKAWDGSIVVGATTLTGPIELDYTSYYTELSSELGGGAVGLAPFNFHQRETAPDPNQSMDCNPYQNEVRALALSEKLDFVEISHYGPVYADGTGPHFRVEFLPGMEVNPIWVDRTSMFEIDSDMTIPNPTGTDDGSASRVVTIKAVSGNKEAFKAAGTWRIRPIPGKVKCGRVLANPDVRYTSSVVSGDLGQLGIWNWYQFEVLMELQPGVFALDSGNGTQASDLAAWISTPFETNADGETNTQDFIDMANQYTGN